MAALMTAGAVLLSSAGGANAQAVTSAAPVVVAKAEASRAASRAEASRFAAPGKTLKVGAKGTAVKVLQTRLAELGYAPGRIDGRYGGSTLSAVWAFQKVNGISPTSTVASRTW